MGLVCVMYVMYTCKKIDLKEAKLRGKERLWLGTVIGLINVWV